MKKFLAVYLGSESSATMKTWEALDEKTQNDKQKAGMAGWTKWAEDHQKSIVGDGGPLGTTKRVDPEGISDTSNEMAAFVIVEAESHEAAAKMFLKHPHFMIFPGVAVEVMECLAVPEM